MDRRSQKWPKLAGSRRVPQIPFPSHRYVPGVEGSHPRRGGVESGEGLPKVQALSLSAPHDNPHFQYGLDLFENQYFWESHEYFEELWHLAKKNDDAWILLKSLIMAAAIELKTLKGDVESSQRLADRLEDLLTSLPESMVNQIY